MDLWFDYQSQQWKYLFEITRAIAARLDLDSALKKALGYAVDLVGGEAGLVALRGSGDTFHFAAHYGIDPRLLDHFEPLLTEIPLTIERDQTPRWRFPELQLRFAGVVDAETLRLQHVMAIPLIASEQLLGVISVFRTRRSAAFTAMDEDALAGFADHVAIAIDHARLYHAAEQRAKELAAVIESGAHGILLADPHDMLLSKVWGPEYKGADEYVRLYITHLRQKIEPDPAHPKYILTERGTGYRFVDYRKKP